MTVAALTDTEGTPPKRTAGRSSARLPLDHFPQERIGCINFVGSHVPTRPGCLLQLALADLGQVFDHLKP